MDEITSKDDIELSKVMDILKQLRHNQKRYRNTGKKEILIYINELEEKADNLIAIYYDRQLNLF